MSGQYPGRRQSVTQLGHRGQIAFVGDLRVDKNSSDAVPQNGSHGSAGGDVFAALRKYPAASVDGPARNRIENIVLRRFMHGTASKLPG